MQSNAFCKYHPKDAASWHCANCEVDFCINCVPQNGKDIFPRCTLCRRTLSSLSIAEQIPPFWNKLSYFFTFPFNPTTLTVIFLYALVMALIPEGKIGLMIFALILFPLTEFLFDLMEQVANGEKLNTDIKRLFNSEKKGLFIKMLFTIGFITLLVVKSTSLIGEWVGYILAAFFILGAPASFIILMMEKMVFSMISPIKISYIIRLFGGAYFRLYFIAALTVVTSLQFNAAANTNNFLAELIANTFSMYLVVVLFSMMGYLVFQHHHELNYSVRSNNLQSLRTQLPNDMTEVEIFLQEGRFEDAQKLLLDKIAANPLDFKANEKLILLYAIQGNDKHLQKIAEEYFKNLIENNKQSHAADFYTKLSNKSVDFFPAQSANALEMAEQMTNTRQYQTGLSLLSHYSCEPNGDKEWDKIALLKAKLLAEFADDIPSGLILLDSIIKRSVDQQRLEYAEKYRAIIG